MTAAPSEAPGPPPRAKMKIARREYPAGISAATVLADGLRACAENLLAQPSLVRVHAPDAVGDMRVATRRLRSILTGFGRDLDRARTAPLVEELKWLGEQLADERDTEVMAERFAQVLDHLPHDLVQGPVAADLDAALGQRAEQDTRHILLMLDGERYRWLHRALEDMVVEPPLCGNATRPAEVELTRSVAKAYRKLERRLHEAIDVRDELERADALHEARKAVKRVRYMCEIIVPAVGRPAKRLHKSTEKLQQLLGEHQDAAVARPTLHRLGRSADRHGHSAFTYGVLYAAEHFRAKEVERELPAYLERMRTAAATWLGES